MKSLTALKTLYGRWTQNTTVNNLANGIIGINESIGTLYNLRGGKWKFLEDTVELDTVQGQRSYQIPNKFRKVMDVYTHVGNTIYMPEPVFDPNRWKLILAYNMQESDIPLFYYVEGSKIHFAPIPATTDNTITVRGRLTTPDLSFEDYTTGTIVTATNGSKVITGNATAWTTGMVGRWLRITSTSAANGGDGYWYEVESVDSTTQITLKKEYEGTSIVAGAATYTLGQMSLIPEAYDVAPVYRAVAQYWDGNGEIDRAVKYWRLYDGGYEMGLTKVYGGLIGQMLENEGESVEGVYIPPFGSTSNVVNTGAWFSPWQSDASGF
jgi:hypothetical protein